MTNKLSLQRATKPTYFVLLIEDGWLSNTGREAVHGYDFKLVKSTKVLPKPLALEEPESLGRCYRKSTKIGTVGAFSLEDAWKKAACLHPAIESELEGRNHKYPILAVGSAVALGMGSQLKVGA